MNESFSTDKYAQVRIYVSTFPITVCLWEGSEPTKHLVSHGATNDGQDRWAIARRLGRKMRLASWDMPIQVPSPLLRYVVAEIRVYFGVARIHYHGTQEGGG